MLLTVLATLPFIAALAVACIALQATVSGKGEQIVAALRGRSPLSEQLATRPVTVKFSPRRAPARLPLRAEPRLRAAA